MVGNRTINWFDDSGTVNSPVIKHSAFFKVCGIYVQLVFPLTFLFLTTTGKRNHGVSFLQRTFLLVHLLHGACFPINTSVSHNMHHQYFKGNYGLYFTIWDRLMGTMNKNYDKSFEEITSRTKELSQYTPSGKESNIFQLKCQEDYRVK